DRYVDGRRISYWNPATQRIAGQNAIVDADRQDKYVQDNEVAVRFYRPLLSYEIALYAYRGFWKSPAGVDIETGNALFPDMNAYGASIRGTLGSALVNAEAGYYDSLEEHGGTDPFIPNSEVRFLTGYERELAKNLTAGMQYYLEWMMDYAEYKSSLLTPNDTARDEFRHVLTLRLTKMLMNQNLTLGLFTFYSPSDKDAYLRPSAAYRISDHWTASLSGNIFLGEDDHTFFGQFRHNNNFSLGLRYSF
ncbi:MAG TPA: hypothetical protein VIR77_05600, partial [Pontiella sp.]